MQPTPPPCYRDLAQLPDHRIDLPHAALLIAADHQPDLDVARYRAHLDELGALARRAVGVAGTRRELVERLNRFVYQEQGFAGNEEAYDDPRNSMLHEVLERRRGIPITLAVVYMELGRHVGLTVRGVSFPGHFLVKVMAEEPLFVDPFHGRVLSEADCEALLQRVAGPGARLQREHLQVSSNRGVVVRMLRNLKRIYLDSEQWEAALGCCNRILLLVPELLPELQERGMLYMQLECFPEAQADLERCLELELGEEVRRSVEQLLGTVYRHARPLN